MAVREVGLYIFFIELLMAAACLIDSPASRRHDRFHALARPIALLEIPPMILKASYVHPSATCQLLCTTSGKQRQFVEDFKNNVFK